MSPAPTCSIVLPTYNRADLVGEAIESVLAQTTDDWELIVVDDGSTDGTPETVSVFLDDTRVQYHRETHRGSCAARNAGIAQARGELLGFLDHDDRFVPRALEIHLDAFAANPEAAMTIGGYECFGEEGGGRRPWTEGIELTPESWLFDCLGINGAVMIRREWLSRAGGFAEEAEGAEDWDLFLRLSYAGCPMIWAPDVVQLYRRHPGTITADIRRSLASSQRVLDRITATADIPPSLGRRARAWLFAVYARKALAAGDDVLAREALAAATALRAYGGWQRRGLSLSPEGTAVLLERLVADAGPGVEPARLAARWGVGIVDIRRAAARVAMRRFFEAVAETRPAAAAAHLRAGLRRDPRWLANRGVLGFLARRPVPRIGDGRDRPAYP